LCGAMFVRKDTIDISTYWMDSLMLQLDTSFMKPIGLKTY
jgi:hypothetical protein